MKVWIYFLRKRKETSIFLAETDLHKNIKNEHIKLERKDRQTGPGGGVGYYIWDDINSKDERILKRILK